jgi:hypothetical protein
LAIEAEVGDDEFMGAGRDGAEDVTARFINEGGDPESGNLNPGALQEVARAEIGNIAGNGGALGKGGGEGEKDRESDG